MTSGFHQPQSARTMCAHGRGVRVRSRALFTRAKTCKNYYKKTVFDNYLTVQDTLLHTVNIMMYFKMTVNLTVKYCK